MKDLAIKFGNGLIIGIVWLLLMFSIGLGIKVSYFMFLKGWNLI